MPKVNKRQRAQAQYQSCGHYTDVAVDDILGLFDQTPSASVATSPPPPAAAPAPAASAFALPQTQQPAPQQAAVPKLTAYPAYDKNELRISLTPQTSAQRPGIVNILARFQVTGSTPAVGLNFQAAVPKVRFACDRLSWIESD